MGPGQPIAVIADRPGPQALADAFAAAEAGLSFRVGNALDPPQAGEGWFETLTSGTSGAPRRILRRQDSWTRSFTVNATLFGLGPGVRVAIPGRLCQSLALYGAMEAVHLGAEVHLLDRLRPDRQVAALAARGAQVIYATPAQLRLMLGARPVAGLRLVLCGGSKLDPATRAGLAHQFPDAELREFYGAAETSFITLTDATTPAGSVGRPYPGVELDLRNGEIRVRSPYLFEAYAGDAGSARREGDFVSVGEIGEILDGCLYLHGSAGRMVTVADQNVFPEEIEAFLLTQPGVQQAAILPRPDPLRGAVLEAVVQGGDAGALSLACRARLGPLKAPRRFHIVTDWPLLPSGKTDLGALRGMVG